MQDTQVHSRCVDFNCRLGFLLLMLLLGGAGCGHSDGGTTAGNRPSDPPPEVNKPSPETAETAAADEAMGLALKCAEEHWNIQESGTVWTGHTDKGFESCPPNADMQFRPVTPHLVTEDISEADRLNGLEWRGSANFSAPAYRHQRMNKPWSDWESWTLGTFWSAKLEKRNGTWSAVEQSLLLKRGRIGTSEEGDDVFVGFYTVESRKPTSKQDALWSCISNGDLEQVKSVHPRSVSLESWRL